MYMIMHMPSHTWHYELHVYTLLLRKAVCAYTLFLYANTFSKMVMASLVPSLHSASYFILHAKKHCGAGLGTRLGNGHRDITYLLLTCHHLQHATFRVIISITE